MRGIEEFHKSRAPLCAHSLSGRPTVLPGRSRVHVRFTDDADGAVATFDGQPGVALQPGDVLGIQRSEQTATFARLEDYDFLNRLRAKLSWGV